MASTVVGVVKSIDSDGEVAEWGVCTTYQPERVSQDGTSYRKWIRFRCVWIWIWMYNWQTP